MPARIDISAILLLGMTLTQNITQVPSVAQTQATTTHAQPLQLNQQLHLQALVSHLKLHQVLHLKQHQPY